MERDWRRALGPWWGTEHLLYEFLETGSTSLAFSVDKNLRNMSVGSQGHLPLEDTISYKAFLFKCEQLIRW